MVVGAQNHLGIFRIENVDSVLTEGFIKSICQAIESQEFSDGKYVLENLIQSASSGFGPDSTKTRLWHSRFGNQCLCPNKEGVYSNFLRMVVLTNFRGFANHIGPKNRTSLDFELKDPSDSLNIYDFVNSLRKKIEAEHEDKRFEFQQDERWRNLMFFYFLFSEFYLKQYE